MDVGDAATSIEAGVGWRTMSLSPTLILRAMSHCGN